MDIWCVRTDYRGIDDAMYGYVRRCRKVLEGSPRTEQPTRLATDSQPSRNRVATGAARTHRDLFLFCPNGQRSLIASDFTDFSRSQRTRRDYPPCIQSFVRFQGTSLHFRTLEGCSIDFTIGPPSIAASDLFPSGFTVSATIFATFFYAFTPSFSFPTARRVPLLEKISFRVKKARESFDYSVSNDFRMIYVRPCPYGSWRAAICINLVKCFRVFVEFASSVVT